MLPDFLLDVGIGVGHHLPAGTINCARICFFITLLALCGSIDIHELEHFDIALLFE